MKPTTLFVSILLMACSSKDVTPTTIVSKWSPTYITQNKQADGTFDAWHRINTLVALPVYEFTSDGLFLRDGKPGADCCSAGNKYGITDGKILFTERLICPTVLCLPCGNWTIDKLEGDTLILNECYARNKYVKTK